jgi:pimeloyl-ACP methyl ester carboxylesterase
MPAEVAEAAELVTIKSLDGTPLALWKTGTGPSLLVVHGGAADHTSWDRVVPLLMSDFTVYAMDRRGRVAAAHTIPRELRALNDYGTDFERFAAIDVPVLLIAGELTERRRREMFERLAPTLQHARLVILPGQRHAADQTAPHLLAGALRDFLTR